jgi:hemerythrin superfamily protein
MDIYTYLKKDHRKVSDLMEQVLDTNSPSRRESIFDRIYDELLLHAETEQATFYAALEDEEEVEENIEDAEEEHAEMKDYMKKLSSMSAEEEEWIEIFGEFKHAVEHHVKDEEGRIFDKAKQILSSSEAKELAEDMARLKSERFKGAA